MTEQEEFLFKRRKAKFVEEGFDLQKGNSSTDLANQMMMRDRDPDDHRRLCFECQNFAVKFCTKKLNEYGGPSHSLKYVLQNCVAFKLKGSK